MSFIALPGARDDVADRAESGRRGVRFPVSGREEVPIVLGGCRTCDKREAHGEPCAQLGVRLSAGEVRHSGVAGAEQSDGEDLQQLFSALWETGRVVNGIPRGTLYNLGAGTANNISQDVRCRIVAVNVGGNPRRMRLSVMPTGQNVKALLQGVSRLNPEWPLPDPQTGETSRLIVEGMWHALPLGAEVAFAFPSVLHGKVRPMVTRIYPPSSTLEDGTEFEVEVSHAVTRALEPYDRLFPAAEYFCELVYYAVAPEAWPNWQRSHESAFSPVEQEVTKASLESTNMKILLVRNNGAAGKVLWPGMATFRVVIRFDDDEVRVLTAGEIRERLEQTRAGGLWETRLVLDELTGEARGYTVDVAYSAEAVEGDAWCFPFEDRCANAQRDWTQSYVDKDEFRCMDTRCEQYGSFEADCWWPGADRFDWGVERGRFPQSDSGRERWFARNWSRVSFVLEQGIPGVASHRNFSYRRPAEGGPSIQEWVGGFRDDVPRSPSAGFLEPLFRAKLGQRHVYTEDGAVNHRLVFGAFCARKWRDDGEGGFETLPFEGYGVDLLEWGDREDARGAALDDAGRHFPLDGPEACSVATYENGVSGFAMKKRVSELPQEMFVTRVSRVQVNTALSDAVRNALP